MNNHQNAIFHQITNFLKTPLALLGVDLKNFQFNKICHFANHPYLCKGLKEKMKKIIQSISMVSSLAILTACGNLALEDKVTFEKEQLPKIEKLVINKNIDKQQANQMILTARKYAAFWDTGIEKYAKQALANDFIDLNLPQGRKQGKQGPLNASKWFRGVVPNLSAKIKEMIIAKNQVISRLEFTGSFTGKFHNTIGRGQKIKFSAVDIYTVKNGKIQTNWHLEDNQSLMNQLTKYPSTKGFKLSSNAVKEGKNITANQYWNNFGCSGKNERPDLSWTGTPKNTKSFAVSFYDKDAPTDSGFWHWTAYNIPADTTNINPTSLPKGAVDANTDMGKPGYFGPCPPVGRTHNYVFTLHALDVEKLTPPKGATSALVRFFINQHTIAKATLSVVAGPRK